MTRANTTCGCSSVAEHQLPKLNTGVRFPVPAPHTNQGKHLRAMVTAGLQTAFVPQANDFLEKIIYPLGDFLAPLRGHMLVSHGRIGRAMPQQPLHSLP